MDPGVPQTSKRTTTRPPGSSAKTATGKAAGKTDAATKSGNAGRGSSSSKSNGASSVRPGPVDPRTEDPSTPTPRTGKTLWRRPGLIATRGAKTHDVAVDAPVDFSVATPLAPNPPAAPVVVPTELKIVAEPARPTSAKTVEMAPEAPTELAPSVLPAELAPTVLPADLAPTVPVGEPVLPETVRAPILYDQAATIDDVTQIGPILDQRPLRKPIQFRRAPRPRVRRVTRVVRHVDTWSVFKVALVFSVFFYAVSLIAGVLLWQVAYATGTIDNVEKFFEGFGWETFKFNGGQIYHNAWIAGLFVAIGLTGLAVLLATMFNLITDLVGGIRLSVLEEEVRTREQRGTEPAPQELEVVVDPVVIDPMVIDDGVLDGEQSADAPTASMSVESGSPRPIA